MAWNKGVVLRESFAISVYLVLYSARTRAETTSSMPNVVIFFVDDWGWGDLGANWEASKGLTPHLDRIADEGMRFKDFHAAASVCTPSRASLLTGRLGLRTGVVANFDHGSDGGLPQTELTIAELLKEHTSYRTGMIGKWHLGMTAGHHPNDRGFDSYMGVPYSLDMGCTSTPQYNMAPFNEARTEWLPSCAEQVRGAQCPYDTSCGMQRGESDKALPLYENRTIVEQPAVLEQLSGRNTAAAEEFIRSSAAMGSPFFLYYAAPHVHVPLNTDPRWESAAEGKLPGKEAFAAALLELDDEVGRLREALEEAGVAGNTLILVAGDNGPWACKCNLSGSAGPYHGIFQQRQGGSSLKATTWEGGHRVVGLAHWPGKVPAGALRMRRWWLRYPAPCCETRQEAYSSKRAARKP
ncbi:hypothetical protein CYMTET_19583 [Cymbomonas tetramitiformis]|uniref:Sulfatase N-terminal domain-containing protein n=1 Tax=Cymbomonas tetramitiformis TaxID=36881 RepID=A0AAE0L518_9CHLO|nr:hypothetical protein CYMTET_19583 [Cymbomonas tetramitiformis]